MKSGQCLCGQVKFTVNNDPVLVGHCHCLDCQKSSGAGHASFAFFAEINVSLNGQFEDYTVEADAGGTMTRKFCPSCGSKLFARSSNRPDLLGISLTSFDDAGDFKPTVNLFTSRLQRWDALAPDVKCFEKSLVTPD